MMQMLRMFKNNPQHILQQMMMNNPKMQEINNLIQQYGSPEKAFRHKAEEMGIDADEFIGLLK